jgi:NAD-dependent SIR2 family protein deacetylase
MPNGATIFTSNVDGQFQKAGFDPLQIHEFHGTIHHLQCLDSCIETIWPADDVMPEVDTEKCRMTSPLPTCPHCGGLARPNILMFGDWDWQEQRSDQQAKQQDAWLNKLTRPVVIEIGAGKAIPSVRHFSERVITQYAGRLIRINPREWQVPTPMDVGLQAGALAGLEAISEMLGGDWII